MKPLKFTLMTGVAAMVISGAAIAQNTMNNDSSVSLSNMEDDAIVTLTGTVAEISGDEFQLNYGGNEMITVELDNFGFTGDETEYLTIGESVTVRGVLDDDLFEGREIEASDVRLNDSYVYYYYDVPAMSTDMSNRNNQDNQNNDANQAQMNDGAYVYLTGEVTEVENDMAMVSDNSTTYQVDMSELGYDATDDEGMQKIEVGDVVYLYGEVESGFFTDKQIVADGIVEMRERDASMRTGNNTQGNNNDNNQSTM